MACGHFATGGGCGELALPPLPASERVTGSGGGGGGISIAAGGVVVGGGGAASCEEEAALLFCCASGTAHPTGSGPAATCPTGRGMTRPTGFGWVLFMLPIAAQWEANGGVAMTWSQKATANRT